MSITLSADEFRKLVAGRFTVFACPACFGNGWYWVHETGDRRNPAADESKGDFYRHECNFDDDDCGGVGFRVVYKDEE